MEAEASNVPGWQRALGDARVSDPQARSLIFVVCRVVARAISELERRCD